MEIITNNVPRHLIYGCELSDNERMEFDYLSEDELSWRSFFKYKGDIYDLGEFMRITETMTLHNDQLKQWHGYMADSYFSGIVVKYNERDESVIVGSFFC